MKPFTQPMPPSTRNKLNTTSTWLLLACSTAFNSALHAAETAAVENGDYQQLLELLEEQTTIATKTRLNADYVPGMVTVLHGKEMENSGSRTVWEALAKVPGIETSIEETGRKQIIIRGTGRTYGSGNVKIMLNGVAMNTAKNATANPVLKIPIEQVERIEVIRGPGSAIHGEYAYTGVINVITRSEESMLYVRGAEGQHRGAGGVYSYRAPDSDLAIDLNIGRWSEDGVDVTAGEDILYVDGLDDYSNAPGPSNEAQEQTTAVFSLQKSGYRLKTSWLEDGSGDYFGINHELPTDNRRIVLRNTYQSVELGKNIQSGDKLTVDVHASWLRIKEDVDRLYAFSSAPAADNEPPYVVDSYYEEEQLGFGFDIGLHLLQQHQFLFGYNTSYTKAKEYETSWGLDGGVMVPFDPVFEAGTNRRIHSLTLQDEYRPSGKATITLGLRHDGYSDVDSSTTPRLAAVYRLSNEHIFKAQYARAFRPPTFYELGGQLDDLEPSTVETYETGYIYKGLSTDLKFTVFYSDMENPITFVDDASGIGYDNVAGTTVYGTEFEWKHHITPYVEVNGNLSWLQSENEDTDNEPLAGSSDWLGNVGLNIKTTTQSLLNVQYRYVGEVHREVTDSRSMLDSYNTVDMTFNWMPYSAEGPTLRLGVKNAFDEDVEYPAPQETYPDDYPRPGRLWWGSVQYKF